MARKFCYACAGLFLLALSYHLGAVRALAQSGHQLRIGSVIGSRVGVDQGGLIWALGDYGPPVSGLALPKPGNVVAISASPSNPTVGVEPIQVLYDDGDWYLYGNGAWSFRGNIFGTPTATFKQTWGQVKSTYRK
jgi:hypothetical protein